MDCEHRPMPVIVVSFSVTSRVKEWVVGVISPFLIARMDSNVWIEHFKFFHCFQQSPVTPKAVAQTRKSEMKNSTRPCPLSNLSNQLSSRDPELIVTSLLMWFRASWIFILIVLPSDRVAAIETTAINKTKMRYSVSPCPFWLSCGDLKIDVFMWTSMSDSYESFGPHGALFYASLRRDFDKTSKF